MLFVMQDRDLKTEALVLKRTNFGETDRILQIITPHGKISILAKGVRKERSRLAGGIELFSLSDVVLCRGKNDLAILTSAKMKEFYQDLLTDLDNIAVASEILKRVSKAADMTDNEDFFSLTKQCLRALNQAAKLDPKSRYERSDLVQAWFYLNFAKARGEQVNLLYDIEGYRLSEQEYYSWDKVENALRLNPQGDINADTIKLMRLMLAADLNLILRVTGAEQMAKSALYIAKAVNQI